VARCLAIAVVLVMAATPDVAGATAVPGPGRILLGGTQQLKGKEASVGRALDVVRTYTKWENGPTINTSTVGAFTAGGARTVFISSTFAWYDWRATATRVNSDADPNNNVPTPYCQFTPKVPGTSTPSGKTWFRAIADGDYDTQFRGWLQQVHNLTNQVPEGYVTLQHEPDRLTKDAGTRSYMTCLGGPADFKAAWTRMYQLASGAVGGGTDLLNAPTGRIRLVPVMTGWGFWHTPGIPGGAAEKALINPDTGAPLPWTTGDDRTLRSARVTEWQPNAGEYNHLGVDVFNLSGSPAGAAFPTSVKVDDPATPAKENSQWRELSILLSPVMRWADQFAQTPTGGRRTLYLAEYGSVGDPTRPQRRSQWLGTACSYLSSPAASHILGANYFDTNEVQLSLWNWTKTGAGAWNARQPSLGPDSTTLATMNAMARSTRFGGTQPCPK